MTEDVSRKPSFDPSEAERIAYQSFGLTGCAHPLDGERDQNFRIDTDTGRFVLKIAHPDVRRDFLALENKVIRIASEVREFDSPRIVNSLEGKSIVNASSGSSECAVRCLTYVEGVPLATCDPHTPDLLMSIGHALGQLDLSLATLGDPSEAKRNIKWDLARAPEIVAGTLPKIRDESRRKLLEHFLGLYNQIADRVSRLSKSVIQNDANDYNILVDASADTKPSIGLIDYGDLVYSATVNELAICCAYIMLGKQNPLEAAKALIRGYNERRELSASELSCLFPLTCMRLAQSVCISVEQTLLRPGDAYLAISERRAWQMLERLSTFGADNVHAEFLRACASRKGDSVTVPKMAGDEIVAARKRYMSPSLSLSYEHPLMIVRGQGQYLYDDSGAAYLDCVNNVCHVGHCHPHVVEAATRQLSSLNTNTRYLHPNIVTYAQRLSSTFPDPLSVCFFVNSGSEANDLALRLARNVTQRHDIVAVDHAYHGNATSLIDISAYKFNRAGGKGKPEHVHIVPMPDGFRGRYRYEDDRYGARYAADAVRDIESAHAKRPVAAFISEALLGCGGQVPMPPEYLSVVYEAVRKLGGVCIADEVQIGFGRVGSHYWGFELGGVIPDIVTVGKPIGNGHPLGAVITTREIADAFDNGMEYFNTFGGNPVSCAIGLAVMDVIEGEDLQRKALTNGGWLLENLRAMAGRFDSMGDVRGHGLFLGIELVDNRTDRNPDQKLAARIVEVMKQRRILLSTDGPDENVIKFKPPMVFDRENAETLVGALDEVLQQLSTRAV